MKLQILNPSKLYEILQEVVSTKIDQSTSAGRATFNLKSQNILLEDIPDSVAIKLILYTVNGKQDSVFIGNKTNPRYFKSLISLTSYLPIISRYRYGMRDVIEDGGDDWSRPEYFNFIKYLTTGLPRQLDVTFGDLSKMNGGRFPPHGEHNLGNVFDGFIRNYNKDIKKLVSSQQSAEDLITLLNDEEVSTRATKMIVSYETKSAFDSEIQSSCLKNGLIAKNFIKNDLRKGGSHKGHYHLEYRNDINFLGRTNTFEICHKLNNNLKSISLKKCNGPSINQDLFEVWGRKFNTTDSFKKLEIDTNGDYSLGDLVSTISELKIIYLGSASSGCFEKLVYIDNRDTEYNCNEENEYGITHVQAGPIYSSNYSSIFVSETSSIQNALHLSSQGEYRVDISPSTYGDKYSISSLCDGSTAREVTYLTNTKVTQKSIIGNSVNTENTIIKESSINNTVMEQTARLSNVKIIKSNINGYLSFENTDISDSTIYSALRIGGSAAFFKNINIINSIISFDQNKQFSYITENMSRWQISNSTLKNALLTNQFIDLNIEKSTLENSSVLVGGGIISGSTIKNNSSVTVYAGNIIDSTIEKSSATAASGNIENSVIVNDSQAYGNLGIINANLDNSYVSNLYTILAGSFLNTNNYCSEVDFILSNQLYDCRGR